MRCGFCLHLTNPFQVVRLDLQIEYKVFSVIHVKQVTRKKDKIALINSPIDDIGVKIWKVHDSR